MNKNAGTYVIPASVQGKFALLERKAADLARVSDALKGIIALRDGGVLVGISPDLYQESLKALLIEVQALLEELP